MDIEPVIAIHESNATTVGNIWNGGSRDPRDQGNSLVLGRSWRTNELRRRHYVRKGLKPWFPLEAASVAAECALAEASSLRPEHCSPEKAQRRYRVLFADDDLALQRVVKRAIEREGHEVSLAATSEEVFAKALDTKPHLIVLDVGFPQADGRDILSSLKADKRTSDIAVLVWSGGREDPESDRRIAIALGAEDYAEKADASLLVRKIQRLLLRIV